MNLYSYVGNDPVNGVDPTGETTYNCNSLTNPEGETTVTCSVVDDGEWDTTVNLTHTVQSEVNGELTTHEYAFSKTVSWTSRIFSSEQGIATNLLEAWTGADFSGQAMLPISAEEPAAAMAAASDWGGRPERRPSRGANRRDRQQIEQIAREYGVDR